MLDIIIRHATDILVVSVIIFFLIPVIACLAAKDE